MPELGIVGHDAAEALDLWARVCREPIGRESAWVDPPYSPTLVPFDRLTMLSGVSSIVEHLAERDRACGAARLDARAVVSWQVAGGLLVIAEALLRHAPVCGAAEGRKMLLVLCVANTGEMRLRHVTEAVPAVLPLVIETYRRLPRELEQP